MSDQDTPKSSEFLLDISRDYALYVAENRAIPKVADGLKHGQRMALWALRNRSEKIKTVALSGVLAAEKWYVHGDVSCSDAIGKLAAPYNNNIPLIEGLGAFVSRLSPIEGIGAPRYTDVKRSKAAEAFLYKDLDIVPLEDNYDGSNKQPVHFLPLIPTVLLNGISGIAVGWSTDILPRSLKSLITATQDALMGRDIHPMPPFFNHYDLSIKPTGIANQYELSGKAKVLDSSTVQITEIPPGLAIETLRKRLIQMEDNEEIQGFTDRSTKTIDITVKMKRGTVKDWIEKDVLDFFKLREKTTERIVVINWDGKSIRTYVSAEELIDEFVHWRLGWYTVRFKKMLADNNYELRYWQALRELFLVKFPKRLGTFADRAAVEADVTGIITGKIILDDTQMDRVVNLPTYRWTTEFAKTVDEKIAEINVSIAEYQAILASSDRLKSVYNDELEALKGLKL